jgi:hypothetical protein
MVSKKSSVPGWLMTHDIFSCWCGGHVNMLFCSFFKSQDQRWVLEKVLKFQLGLSYWPLPDSIPVTLEMLTTML